MVDLEKSTQRVLDVARASAADVDRCGRFPHETLRVVRDEGLLGLLVGREYGGYSATISEYEQLVRKLGGVCLSSALIYVMHCVGLQPIKVLASETQKKNILTAVTKGKCLIATAISEVGCGSQWWAPSSVSKCLQNEQYNILP